MHKYQVHKGRATDMPQNEMIENPYKVRLTSAVTGGGTVSFDATPSISENRNVNYTSLEPLHAPGQIQVYKNTSSRSFQLSDIKLVSRTIAEAERNLDKLWMMRAWCMPRFGNSSTLSARNIESRNARRKGTLTDSEIDSLYGVTGVELLGAPPPILYLSAYSRTIGTETSAQNNRGTTNVWQTQQHINRIPVVIQQLSIPYPTDVNYIATSNGTPMPMLMSVDLALLETHSPNSYEAFDLDAFKQGILPGF